MDRLIDRIDAVADRHQRALGIMGVLWFALVCADYAGFIDLPEFTLIGGAAGLIVAVLYNAVWWGFLNPRVQVLRAARGGALGKEVRHG